MTSTAVPVTRVGDTTDVLGECPLWDDVRNGIWWLDLKGRFVRFIEHGSTDVRSWAAPGAIGSAALCTDGTLLVCGSAFWCFDPSASGSAAFTEIAALPAGEPSTNRCNDGRVDHQGRLVLGTMDDAEEHRTGTLYRLRDPRDPATIETLWGGAAIPNAACYSPDGRYGYWADSWTPTLYRYETADPAATRVELAPVAAPGAPDGACTDADGHVWLCLWGGSRIVRYRPDGTVERDVVLPVERPTCAAFGGPDFGTLYVTSATIGFTAEQHAAQPLAGGLLAIDVASLFGARGLPERRLALPLA